MKTHAMRINPYEEGTLLGKPYALYKSLCGIKEPNSQSYSNRIVVDCDRCLAVKRAMLMKESKGE